MTAPSGFFRLHPHLQHTIQHELGWKSLRPVQTETIDAVLDGANAVVLAPTAGGKTEASVFPALSRILSEELPAVAVLYVCPIRALLNNQEPRIQQYARMVGLEAFKWHGDVAASKKKRFKDSPHHILMTTPESLEVMLISQKTDARGLLGQVSMVIVDEVHAFADDDRGAHLVSVLERLSTFCGRDIQRIGLSATVGNPAEIGMWLQGSSARPFVLVNPPKVKATRKLRVEFEEEPGALARGIAGLTRGKKTLVFVESRSGAEKIARQIAGRGAEVFVHHSAVSRADRELAEEQFTDGENTAIVCTSTMELGIDVGDLDQVIQVGCPGSVASFLQRIGRTGRRAGSVANCTFFTEKVEDLIKAAALLRLADQGWVEDVVPTREAGHLWAHQAMALSLQEGGISRWRMRAWIGEAFPFAGLSETRADGVIDHMLAQDILQQSGGLLGLGQRGEKLYGRKNFFELYAVFSSPRIMAVLQGRQEIGTLDAEFLMGLSKSDEAVRFRLGGKPWRVTSIDWDRGRVFVEVAKDGRVPSWRGGAGFDSRKLCETIREVLRGPGVEEQWLSDAAAKDLGWIREDYAELLAGDDTPFEERTKECVWHTFAGGRVNTLLAFGLTTLSGTRWTGGNLSVSTAMKSGVAARQAIKMLGEVDWDDAALNMAATLPRKRLSKFQPCLPLAEEHHLLAARYVDVADTVRFLAERGIFGGGAPG